MKKINGTTQKRIEWVATLATAPLGLGLVLGDRHGRRWGRYCWKAEPSDRRKPWR